MLPFQFKVDIVDELEKILPSYQFTVPSFVIEELESIKRASKGKDKMAASIALKIASSPPIKIRKEFLRPGEQVDDALLRISDVLCTNDRGLKIKALEKGISVVYLRQKKYLAVDGHTI